MAITMCNFHIFRYFPLILVMLCSSAASLGLAQEAPGGSLEPESGMTDFYERQKMDEELRALRGDLDKITKRLADIEKAQDLIHELMLKVSNIEGQLQLGDGSQSSLANMLKSLEELIKTIRDRKNSSPDKSYTNKLLNDKNLSVSKVKEEVAELIEAVEKNTNKIHESADVIYHLLVYLEANDIRIEDVMKELEKRKK